MPPQHSVTAPIRFIHREDPVWDRDRWQAELGREGITDEEHDQHPIVLYFSGDSRYDLDAYGTVVELDGERAKVPVPRRPRDYLKPDGRPTTWHLRRLKMTQQASLDDTPRHSARMAAFALGVTKLENGPDGLEVVGAAGPLSTAMVDAVAEHYGAAMIYDVGEAVLRASKAPTHAEKKP